MEESDSYLYHLSSSQKAQGAEGQSANPTKERAEGPGGKLPLQTPQPRAHVGGRAGHLALLPPPQEAGGQGPGSGTCGTVCAVSTSDRGKSGGLLATALSSPCCSAFPGSGT